MRRHLALVATALAILLAGCARAGDDSQVATAGGQGAAATTTTSAQPPADDEERMRQFASCMREHGVDMPDPEPGGGPVQLRGGPGDVDMSKMQAAMQACRSFLPNGGEPRQLSPEDLEKARAMAECMREHGVDVPDPDPDQGGLRIEARGGGGDGAAPPDQDKLRAALEACRHLGPGLGPEVNSEGSGGGT
ncbi:MAG TPA: hypothetical protein VGJ95_18745 [Pseudonocardiaceae bacterium]|jgi:hypothetical protein